MASCVRLFLSVDVAGSTALKELVNYQALEKRIETAEKLLPDKDPADVLRTLAQDNIISYDEYDWSHIQQRVFVDFHTNFLGALSTKKVSIAETERSPWKALGDELVYCFCLKSREQCTQLIAAFLTTLRHSDEKLAKGGKIRVKGSAWTAGFPLRNRQVQLPMPKLVIKPEKTSSPAPLTDFPYPRDDYWGPDMDIGFRLAKASFPGMCVASMDLVEVLGRYKREDQIRAIRVGWSQLKGVWGERPYPVFWLELPASDKPVQVTIHPWAEAESSYVKEWEKIPSQAKEAKGFKDEIMKIREHLPPHLGMVSPYIGEEGDETPEAHRKLLDLVNQLEEHRAQLEGQEIEAGSGDSTETSEVPPFIEEKLLS